MLINYCNSLLDLKRLTDEMKNDGCYIKSIFRKINNRAENLLTIL